MSNFSFLESEWPGLYKPAVKAEASINHDPRAACFHARRTLELAVLWLYAHDSTLKRPYDEQLSALLHEATFRKLISNDLFLKARTIKEIGNLAVHNPKPISTNDATRAVVELFHFLYWLARTYGRDQQKMESLLMAN